MVLPILKLCTLLQSINISIGLVDALHTTFVDRDDNNPKWAVIFLRFLYRSVRFAHTEAVIPWSVFCNSQSNGIIEA